MKKIPALIIIIAIVISLVGCNEKPVEKPTSSKPEAAVSSEITEPQTPSDEPDSSEVSADNTQSSTNNTPSNTDTTVTAPSQETEKETMNFDRSWHDNPATLCFPIEGELDSEAEEMREDIINHTEQSVKVTGKTYYISHNGNDFNDGLSPQTALSSMSGIQKKAADIKSGDAVLFERDGIYRGTLILNDGVYYGAYGEGARPQIYGSKMNYINSEWVNEGNNVWRLLASFSGDVGLIVFNHGESVGYLRDSKSELKQNYDFYCDKSNGNRIYLYLDQDPTKLFKSIEIGYDCKIFDFDNKSNITIENLTFKYTGGHALRGVNTQNITIRYCEIGYVGGSYLNNYKDGDVRYGNGVELMGSSLNTLVEHNWIYQIYDSGITHQGDNCIVKDFTAKNNLVEFCGMGCIEYWHTKNSDDSVSMQNVAYVENMLRFAGYGFGGMQRPDKNMSACIMSNGTALGSTYNKAENFVIENNIFELSTYQLINASSSALTAPVLKGNTYIQVSSRWLGFYLKNENKRFDAMAENIIMLDWGDTEAEIVSLK